MTTSLTEALPRSEFVEHHSAVIEASPDRVWRSLHETRWGDLWLTAPLMVIRGLGRPCRPSATPRLLDDGGPVRVLHTEPGRYIAGARVAKPWQLSPQIGPDVANLDELRGFDEPGWLKYGMDFTVVPLGDGRTRLDTATLCEPTDDTARRRFSRYWLLIHPFSALIRRDMLRAIAARSRT